MSRHFSAHSITSSRWQAAVVRQRDQYVTLHHLDASTLPANLIFAGASVGVASDNARPTSASCGRRSSRAQVRRRVRSKARRDGVHNTPSRRRDRTEQYCRRSRRFSLFCFNWLPGVTSDYWNIILVCRPYSNNKIPFFAAASCVIFRPQASWPIVTNRVAWSVCLSVGLSKTAEPIEMPFGFRARMVPRNHVLDGTQIPPLERGNFEGGGKGGPL